MKMNLRSCQRVACRVQVFGAIAASLAVSGMITGCGMSTAHDVTTDAAGVHIASFSGSVHGGQQPISGATVQLYTVGTSGLKSAATAIGTPVPTDVNGGFTLTGTYNCTGATQVYLLASGGSASTGGPVNSAIRAGAALGSCATLLLNAATTYINVNELTTVAAAYGLAPFASDSLHVGASGSNPAGLVNAIANAQALVNNATGAAGGANLPAGATVPTAEINTLGDIAATCINSSGSGSSSCNALFAATGASNTFDAMMAVAKNPGSTAITALTTSVVAASPFQPTLSAVPNDFTVAITYNASGGFATPCGIALDAAGDAWITNASGTALTELSPTGSVMATTTAAGLVGAQGVAIDKSGNVWVANTAGNSVIKFTVVSGLVTGNSAVTAGGVTAPTAVAIDSGNNVFVTNFNGNSVSGLSSAGAALTGSPYSGGGLITNPSAVSIGKDGSVYVASSNGTAVKLAGATQSTPGSYVATLTDNTLQGAGGIALDASNDVLLTGYTTGAAVAGAVSEIGAAGSPGVVPPLTAGIASPAGAAFDGSSFWVVNGSGSLAMVSYGASSTSSPAAGYGSLNQPQAVAIDSSGSVWVTNAGNNTVSRFVGLAASVSTPVVANVGP